MKKYIKYFCFLSSISTFSSANAAYPAFNSEKICGGNPSVVGIVDLYTPTLTNKSFSGVFIRLTVGQGLQYGGYLYQRTPTEYAYKQMANVAMISLLTRNKVRMCYSGDNIYALELQG